MQHSEFNQMEIASSKKKKKKTKGVEEKKKQRFINIESCGFSVMLCLIQYS
jgi:hypothetical protein